MDADGSLTVQNSFKAGNNPLAEMPRFGMLFSLKKDLDNLYKRCGGDSEYYTAPDSNAETSIPKVNPDDLPRSVLSFHVESKKEFRYIMNNTKKTRKRERGRIYYW